MAQQTAMQQMYEELMAHEYTIPISLIVKCKELIAVEKEHIEKAWDAGYYGYFSLGMREIEFNNGEEYYEKNYKK